MFPLTALNSISLCRIYCWGPWMFTKSWSNHKKYESECWHSESCIPRFHKISAPPAALAVCKLTHACGLFASLYNFDIKIGYVFWRTYIAECGMLSWKARKMEFKLCHNLLQDMKSKCTAKTVTSSAHVSKSSADIPQANAKPSN